MAAVMNSATITNAITIDENVSDYCRTRPSPAVLLIAMLRAAGCDHGLSTSVQRTLMLRL